MPHSRSLRSRAALLGLMLLPLSGCVILDPFKEQNAAWEREAQIREQKADQEYKQFEEKRAKDRVAAEAEGERRRKSAEESKRVHDAESARISAKWEAELAEAQGEPYLTRHPNTSPAAQAAIRARRLIIGLTPNEVFAAIGPIVKRSEGTNSYGTWSIWESDLGYHLNFRDGKLAEWIKRGI